MSLDLITRLIDAGTPAALVAEVAMLAGRAEAFGEMAAQSAPKTASQDKRRAYDRDRKRIQAEDRRNGRPIPQVSAGIPTESTESYGIPMESAETAETAPPPSSPDKSPPDPQKLTPPPTPTCENAGAHEATGILGGDEPKPLADAPQLFGLPAVIVPLAKPLKKRTDKHEIPDDWEPVEFGEKTQSLKIVSGWPPGEIDVQTEHFKAHHGRSGERFGDWQKAWSTWVLNSRRFRGNYGGKSVSHDREDIRDPVLADIARRSDLGEFDRP